MLIFDRGKASFWDDVTPYSTLTIPAVTLEAGSTLIVRVGAHPDFGPVTLAQWGTAVFSNRISAENSGQVRVEIEAADDVDGGTHDLFLVWEVPQTGKGLCATATEIQWPGSHGIIDQITGLADSGPTPSSGNCPNTLFADEALIGVVAGAIGAPLGGAWDHDFVAGQSINTIGGNDVSLDDGYRIVGSVGAYAASKFGTLAVPWAAALATFRDVTQPLPPPSSGGRYSREPAVSEIPFARSQAVRTLTSRLPGPAQVTFSRIAPPVPNYERVRI